MLYFTPTHSFKKNFEALSENDREQVEQALVLLSGSWRHPSLHVKKMKGRDGVWEARATQSLRITFQIGGKRDGLDICILRHIGPHDILRQP